MAAQDSFTVEGNRLRLLPEGAERLTELIGLIDGARTSLRFLYYIYADDAAGRQVRAALLAAAARGVRVSLIVDGFGSDDAADADFFAPLRHGGCAVCRYEPRFGRRYLLRNHQKLALADAEAEARIIVGGFNVEDDYFADGPNSWRDLGLLLEGPAAARLAGYFDALQAFVEQPKGRVRDLNAALARWSDEHGPLRWLIGGPTRRLSPWARTLREDIASGRVIDLIAGYFTPSPRMLRELQRTGGRVRVLTAGRSDNKTTVAAARFTYAGLLKRGARVFEYRAAKLHTKLYVVDDAVQIGSGNFDVRSLFVNLELMLRIEDAAFAAHCRTYVEGELARSVEVTAREYARTGWWQRFKQAAAYVLVAFVDPGVSRGLNWGID
jgi:cardiolipin synthase